MTATQIAFTALVFGVAGIINPRGGWILLAVWAVLHLAFGWYPAAGLGSTPHGY